MIRNLKQLSFLVILLFSLTSGKSKVDVLKYVDPFIGTDGSGSTFPGATTPLGMVQLSPSDDSREREFCSGYHYSNNVIKGFAHNHFSGTGLGGMADILLMPTTGNIQWSAGTKDHPEAGFRSRISHKNESASPGYYSVWLEDCATNVELTTTPRVGFHRYVYQKAGLQNVMIDPAHNIRENVLNAGVEIVSNTELRGFKQSQGACGKRTVYFYAKFSKPFSKSAIAINELQIAEGNKAESRSALACVTFQGAGNDTLEVAVALSYVDFDGAKENYLAEGKGKQFNIVLAQAKELWSDKISKIQIDTKSESQARVFYTAMYHSFIAPNIISDVNGNYVVEGKPFKSSGIVQYSNLSTWDTYRATHPLLTIIDQKTDVDLVNVFISRYTESKVGLGLWEALGFDNFCMIGYPGISVMADAALKNLHGVDKELVYECIRKAAFADGKASPNYGKNNGMPFYVRSGFIPAEVGCGISKTTENNYYDWCIAQLAKQLGKSEDEKLFSQRSLGYRKLYNPSTNYLWPKYADGNWMEMDTTQWDGMRKQYISGNIWAYSAYTPHDMTGAIELWGGKKKYAQWLDMLFSTPAEMKGEQHVDISGFIGKYAHGDEPGHQMPYSYNFVDQPWKTQEIVRNLLTNMYNDTPNGFVNNEDCGQMSSWYIFSALGFYPVCPGDLKYYIGAPLYPKAQLQLENGKHFTVISHNNSDKNLYVQSVTLNGKPYGLPYIQHDDIMKGGELVFEMSSKPNFDWGVDKVDANEVANK